MKALLLTIQITQEELESLPLALRHKISRRWKRALGKQRKQQRAVFSIAHEEDP